MRNTDTDASSNGVKKCLIIVLVIYDNIANSINLFYGNFLL